MSSKLSFQTYKVITISKALLFFQLNRVHLLPELTLSKCYFYAVQYHTNQLCFAWYTLYQL